MWNRWQQGDSLHAIARLLDTTHTSIRRHLVATGGIRPLRRKRSRLALTKSRQPKDGAERLLGVVSRDKEC